MKEFNIVLTSNGFHNLTPRSKEIDELFEKIAKNKKVIIIGNAAITCNIPARAEVKENFQKIGAKEVQLINLNSENVKTILEYDVIYVLGGDINDLAIAIKETNFKTYVLEFLKSGIYIGESAGTIVLSNDFRYVYDIKKGTKPRYDKVLESYSGIGLTTINVIPHYNQIEAKLGNKVEAYEKEHQMAITRLNDGEFILEKYEV